MKLRLLSIGHSYCVGLNRRLPHWIAKVGRDRWEVTACAPAVFRGDLGMIRTAPEDGELCKLRTLSVHLDWRPHVFFYGRGLSALLGANWDLIHMWEEPYILAGGQIAALAPARTPLVYYTCQNIAKNYPPPFAQIERFCFRRTSGWIAMGQSALEAQLARGFTGKPCEAISPGVDTESFRRNPDARAAIRRRLGWDDGRAPVIGFVGRFVAEKGPTFLMSVLDGLKPSWRALLVGAGPLEPELERWHSRHPDRIRVVKGVAHAEVPAWMNAIDVLCVPSQTTPRWREQFGRVIIEAFACGVPVIGSDSGEIPNVVADAGVIVGERDASAWTSALERLLADPDERRQLGERGRDLAVTRYSYPEVAARHIRFFERILDAGNRKS